MKKQFLFSSLFVVITLLITSCGSSERKFTGLKLNGPDDYVDLGFSPQFTANDNFTFEAWVKLLDTVNQSSVILGPSRSHLEGYGLYTHHTGKLSFGFRTHENFAILETKNFLVNKWLHLAGVFNKSESKVYLYIDGELITSSLFKEGDNTLTKNKFVINGKEALHGEGIKRGRTRFIISDARIWNTVRNQNQIKENMLKTLTGSEPGLVGYWPFNEMKGTIAKDLSQNQNHGTIHGGTWYSGR